MLEERRILWGTKLILKNESLFIITVSWLIRITDWLSACKFINILAVFSNVKKQVCIVINIPKDGFNALTSGFSNGKLNKKRKANKKMLKFCNLKCCYSISEK